MKDLEPRQSAEGWSEKFETNVLLGTLLGMNLITTSDPPQERTLLNSSVAGDTDAFADLYRTHIKAVYWYALHILGDIGEAEDIAHDVFALAWDKKSSIQVIDQSLLPWLLVTARNLSLNRVKKTVRDRNGRSFERNENLADTSRSPEREVEAGELMAAIIAVVSNLSLRDQTLYYLCIDEGLSYARAAAAMGISHGTVRNQLSRLRRTLRVSLADQKANFS